MSGQRPKRPLSSYMLWLSETRESIKKENPEYRVTDIAKRGGELWRGLEHKEEWQRKAIILKEQYDKAVKEYEENAGPNSVSKKRKKKTKKRAKKVKNISTDEEEDESE